MTQEEIAIVADALQSLFAPARRATVAAAMSILHRAQEDELSAAQVEALVELFNRALHPLAAAEVSIISDVLQRAHVAALGSELKEATESTEASSVDC